MFNKILTTGLIASLLTISNISSAQYVFEQLDFTRGNGHPRPGHISVIDTFLYLTVNEGTNGREPWISDGTQAGSKMIKDIFPGKDNSSINASFTLYNGKVYFVANDGTNGYELWVTDGTTNGTTLVKDIYPGIWFSNPSDFATINGKLFFTADDGTNGKQYWVTDGTTNGTQLAMNIFPLSISSAKWQFTLYNGKYYFSAADVTHGTELWVTDGTANGTSLVKDILPGKGSSNVKSITAYNNKLYFYTTDGLWESDGTANGTQNVKKAIINHDESFSVYNGKMYFNAKDSTGGFEPYISDGTANGTQLLKDIDKRTGRSSNAQQFTVVGNQLFFSANNGLYGDELWVTDGTTNGTKMVKDIMFNPHYPTMGSRPRSYTAYGNKLFFTAKDSTREDELWTSDGTSIGTKKILTHGIDRFVGMYLTDLPFLVCNNAMYFMAYRDGMGYVLWKMTDTTKTPIPNGIAATPIESGIIKIAPNPAHSKVHITLDKTYKDAKVSITYLTGKLIFSKAIDATQKNIELTLPTVPTGVYLLNVHHRDGIITERLLIE